MLVPEKVTPEKRLCDKHKNPSACEGEVQRRLFYVGTGENSKHESVEEEYSETPDLCQKAHDEAYEALVAAITPRTRKSKKAEATA